MLKFHSISDKKISLALHAIAWIIVIIIPLYLTNAFGGGNLHRLYQFYVHTVSAAIVFYVGYLWLVPRFFLQDRKAIYFFILTGLIFATYFLTSFINDTLLFDAVQDAKFRRKSGYPGFRWLRPPG